MTCVKIIRQSTSKRISEKRIAYLTDKLIKLSKQSFCAIKKTSQILEEVRLSERRQVVLNDLVALAQPLPEYDILRSIPGITETTATSIIGELGDIRRFQSTNSWHNADFYEKRKDNTFNKSSCSSINTSSHSDNVLPQVPNLYHPC